jgi:hypothetical protein
LGLPGRCCANAAENPVTNRKTVKSLLIKLMCLVLQFEYEPGFARFRVLNLTQAGTLGALKYDEWEKESSGRINVRVPPEVNG